MPQDLDLLAQLNSQQKKAVQATEGPVLVIAGAGSGKTRALTHRIAYLIQIKGISPHNILAVTFTNKASREMLERVKKLLSLDLSFAPNQYQSNQLPHLGTFHSISARLLRQEIEILGYSKSFQILDDQDQLTLIKKILKELSLSPEQFNPRSILGTISKAKNQLLEIDDFLSQANGFYEETVAKVFSLYHKKLRENQALDFDDLLLLTVKLFQQHPHILEKYQKLFQYILVDEYQDTNQAQYTLIKLLSQKHQNIFAVGDDWQAIYGWRQADIRNILNFEKDFPQAQVIKLEQNYRSTQTILKAANQIITQNANQKKKTIWTKNPIGNLIVLHTAYDEKDEASFITQTVQKEMEQSKKINYNHFAVFYRTNAQSRALEESFLKQGLPYRIIGGIKFYQRKEVKDIIAYLRFISNPHDKVALERIINAPKRGIGQKTLEKWLVASVKEGKNPWDLVLNHLEKIPLQSHKRNLLLNFIETLEEIKQLANQVSLKELVQKTAEKTGYQTMLESLGEEGEVRWENIQELLSVAKKYDGSPANLILNSFLEEVALATDTDNIAEDQPVVHLMTLHSAKGLEFPIIFMTGLEENLLPHSRSLLSNTELEEERRLMYVGLTRAQKKAYLTYAELRTIFGNTQTNAPSRFLDEIPTDLLEKTKTKKNQEIPIITSNFNSRKPSPQKSNSKLPKNPSLKDGDHVFHPQFGKGLVVATQKDMVTIAFSQVGLKKLSTKYAPLKKL